MKKIKQLLLLSLLASFLFSCAVDDEISSDDNPSAFGIRHDKLLSEYELAASNQAPYNTTEHPDFASVICFTYSLDGSSQQDFVATGVLVAPFWILTAGHNFFVADEQNDPAKPEGITVNIGTDPNNPTETYSVEELVFHPTWLNQSEVIVNANDLCLVRISSPINNIAPVILNSELQEPISSKAWYSGYGDYSFRPDQDNEAYSKRHAVENILDRQINGINSETATGERYEGGLVAFDFDSPLGTINSLGDDFTSEDEPLLGGGTSDNLALDLEGTTVEGDSGGPLFLNVNGEWVVVGILSGGANEPIEDHVDGSYGDISIFTKVSTSLPWINSIIR